MKKLFLKILIVFVVALGLFIFVGQRVSCVVRVEHTFNAPVSKVWQIWTDTEFIKHWWSPKGYSAPVIKNDFKLGGTYLFSMQAPDGKMSWNVGKYTEIIPNQKIVSTMSFSDENGNVVPASHYGIPGRWPNELTVKVDFKEVDGKTQVLVEETGIPMIMYVFSKMGWGQQFEKFETLLN